MIQLLEFHSLHLILYSKLVSIFIIIVIIIIIIIYCTYTCQLREVTTSLVMNILPNGLTEQHHSHQTDFCEILYLGSLLKIFDHLIF